MSFNEVADVNTSWNDVSDIASFLLIKSSDFLLINTTNKLIINLDGNGIFAETPTPTTNYNSVAKPT